MRTPHWGALAAALILVSPARAERWNAIESVPDATPIPVQVNGKTRVYFRVTSERALVFAVTGPAQVRLTTRVEMPAGSRGVFTYQLRVNEGGKTLDQMSTEASAADGASVPEGSVSLGKSRALTFDVADGPHRLSLVLSGAGAVLVRIQQSGGPSGRTPMVSLTPVSAARSVSVAEGEKVIPYYSVFAKRPVRLRVVGPTTLELTTRLDFDATMRGSASYRLRLIEKGRILRELEFRTTKATTATYTNLPDRVPSKLDRVTVPLPEGLHEIAVELAQPARGSAEIHARIPQPSVGNQE